MKPSEYLDKCKIALNVQTDYALAKRLELTTPRISDYYKGKRWPDAYACARIALTLKLDPFEVLCDIEAQTAKTESRAAFWTGFIGRSRRGAGFLLLALICGISCVSGSADKAAPMLALVAGASWLLFALRASYNVYYVKSLVKALRQKSRNWLEKFSNLICAA